jgi:hypothetical protein|tara:strand:+ start:136 stop:789 length:654 start_codon:yes stop_codon:yes gene_type:complete
MFFKSKLYRDNYYCQKCAAIVQAKDIEEENKKLEQIAEKRKKHQLEKAKIRNDIADKKLVEELESEKRKQRKKAQKKAEKLRLKQQRKAKEVNIVEEYSAKGQTHKLYFDRNTIQQHDVLLYIEAEVNQLIAVEWLHGKKRVVLNNKREVRRTKAGGFSAEKFQKFVDAKKRETVDWAIELLNRPGVLRDKYSLIKVVSTKDNLKEKLESYLKKYRS